MLIFIDNLLRYIYRYIILEDLRFWGKDRKDY